MSYKLLISQFAELDLLDSMTWYEEQREGLSTEFELSITAAFELIQRNPFGFQIRYDDVRIAFTNRFPYGIHFVIEDERVLVIGIYHTSRDPNLWTERRKKIE